MVLRISSEELELMQSALRLERKRILSEIGQLHYVGASQAAMQLCRRRSAVDDLLDHLEHQPEPLTVVPSRPQVEEMPALRKVADTSWQAA